ncbi:hypothetical protein [Cytobacillus purgationiresistens]|uniref:DUF4145 domain-containing protein n=1 Tax=Cytobacillus purgationiresistens TaxID=863449 RepID=A0ABU0AQK0_9BACI|nr:hypothetical protein [Cytobacillus purgationiresistens]MDQ0273527.1 hypothetical protein [Cytobacillus purgationiresistens]
MKPELNIDSISVMLIVLALVPWFIQYIKSLEINGLGKVELITEDQKQAIQKNADEAGIFTGTKENKISSNYTFYNLRYEDPKLALAGLRIELEKTLIKLVEKNSLDGQRLGLNKMTNILSKNNIITSSESSLIYDISGILNRAVHSQLGEYNSETFDWVFDVGVKLLDSLGKKLSE